MTPRILAAGAMLMLSVSVARADVVYDTISGLTPFGSDGASDGVGVIAGSFTAPGTVDFHSLTLGLSAGDPTDAGSVMVYLVPDSGGGTEGIASTPDFADQVLIGSILDTSLATGAASVTLPGFLHIPTMNDVYWIAVDLSGSSADLWYNADGPGFGTANQLFSNDGTLADLSLAGAYEMTVDTPEPATIAILGGGLAGLGYFRRRRAANGA
jgi:PEP-CTERM motif